MYPRDADTWTRTGTVWSEYCHHVIEASGTRPPCRPPGPRPVAPTVRDVAAASQTCGMTSSRARQCPRGARIRPMRQLSLRSTLTKLPRRHSLQRRRTFGCSTTPRALGRRSSRCCGSTSAQCTRGGAGLAPRPVGQSTRNSLPHRSPRAHIHDVSHPCARHRVRACGARDRVGTATVAGPCRRSVQADLLARAGALAGD
eukprot:4986821-Prymnesium_polylepis.1